MLSSSIMLKPRLLSGAKSLSTLPVVLTAAGLLLFTGPVARIGVRPASAATPPTDVSWPLYGGPLGQHYSPLSQINVRNVAKLKVAWSFNTGEDGGLETTPIVIGDALYACTPNQKIIKLDAATGKLLWTFDSGISSSQPSRGVSYWTDGKQSRILAGVMNYVYALDPETGKPIPTFGDAGRIDLRKDLRGDYRRQSIALTTPGTIYKNLIITGGRNPESYPAPPGDVRAYDVMTGALRWTFHTIPHPGEPGYETWPKDAWTYAGAANAWAGMTLDEARGIVYVPTGSAVFDFYGGDRLGNDLYANTLLALDAATGKLLWHFQAVHHDIWDRDLPSPPTLITVLHDGKRVDAVAQTTKQGFVYVLDRVTGNPLYPVEEVKTLPSDVPGEAASPTQPRPLLPAPFARQDLTADMLTTRTPEAHATALKQFMTYRSAGQFVPLSVDKITLLTPGFDGGGEWGGSAFDPISQVLYINGNNTSWLAALVVPPHTNNQGETVYRDRCSMCHGIDRAGQPPAFPSLIDIHARQTDDLIASQVHNGKGRMPAFSDITPEQMKALLQYLDAPEIKDSTTPSTPEMAATTATPEEVALANRIPYKFSGYKKFLDPDGYPAVATPWGTLNALDMKTGKYLWQVPLGEYPELTAKGVPLTGTENYGGPIVTAGGVLFIASTVHDDKIRAFDPKTGKMLWEAKLPFAGLATPTTYMVGGKQYVVIGAGGGKDTPGHRGGVYVAFTLP